MNCKLIFRGGDYTESLSLPQKLVVNSIAFYRPIGGGSWVLFVGRKDGSIAAFCAGNDQPVAILHEHKSNGNLLFFLFSLFYSAKRQAMSSPELNRISDKPMDIENRHVPHRNEKKYKKSTIMIILRHVVVS